LRHCVKPIRHKYQPSFAGFADEADYESIAQQVLIPKTVLGKREIALAYVGVKMVQCVLTLPGAAKRVPCGRDAGAANVKSTIRGDEAIPATQKI
jgi:hypothetical protein